MNGTTSEIVEFRLVEHISTGHLSSIGGIDFVSLMSLLDCGMVQTVWYLRIKYVHFNYIPE